MAHRDRSQGFGFMYVNIAQVLEQRKQGSVESTVPVITQNVHHANFNKDTVGKTAFVPPPVTDDSRTQAMKQIRENLDRLQTLHHKLHAMLDELSKISSTPKRSGKN